MFLKYLKRRHLLSHIIHERLVLKIYFKYLTNQSEKDIFLRWAKAINSHWYWWCSGHATPNIAGWHSKYHKLKSLREQQKRERSHFDFLPCPSSPKTDHKILLPERSLPINKHLYLQRGRHTECKQTSLAKLSQFTALPSSSLTSHIPPQLSTLTKLTVKILFLWSLHFLMKAPLYIKLILNRNLCAFLLLIYFCQFFICKANWGH